MKMACAGAAKVGTAKKCASKRRLTWAMTQTKFQLKLNQLSTKLTE
jgi:hypothetical protein